MAAVRLFLIMAVLVAFLLVGTPLQRLASRYRPALAPRLPLLFCRSLLALTGVRLVVEGDRARGRPVLIVANHVSWIDILAMGALAPFCFLAKSEIARWPVVSAFAAVQGTIFVERRRRRSIPAANRLMAARMGEGRPVLLFPEGTTVAGPIPGRFHSSHFGSARDLLAATDEDAFVLVQPVAIDYSRADAAWVGDDALLPHLWRVLRRPPLTCRVAFGAPLTFGQNTDRKAIALAAREAVVATLARRTATAAAILPGSFETPAAAIGGRA